WAPVIFVAIYAVAPVFFLPGLPLTLLAGLLFGPVAGVAWAITGATIGATISFLIARYLVRDWVARRIAGTRMAGLYERAEREGWKLVAVTRLIPLFPFNLLNYAFGITAVPLGHYAITSFICMLPACVAYVVFGSSLPDVLAGRISPKLIIGIGLIVLLNVVIMVVRKRKAVAR
ncbi:MAG: TVP38/TMEM64 family protein, partial [Deltaproteobacteria bacterium]|nr:TVP38/TMEM64 family protein [Candidatus Anaeroferrophillacea bacterium]